MQSYQTIIIGAGPAGLTAGKHLKDAVILEQKKEIGRPIQCIGMSVKTLARQNLKPDSSWVKTDIYKVERVMPNGKVIGKFKKQPIGYIVKKSSFEKFLAKEIKCDILLGKKVIDLNFINGVWQATTDSGDTFQSKYIIAADGFDSITRKRVFPESEKFIESAFGLEYVVQFLKLIDSRVVKIYLNNEVYQNSYAWVFPTSNFTANIGVGGKNQELLPQMNRFLEKEITRDYGSYQIINENFGRTASKKMNFPFFKSNIFLVGDAAGFDDPIFKAGTNQAMISAKIACQCILENRPMDYTKIIESLPFAKLKVKKAADYLYSFSNELLNKIGDKLENRGFLDMKNPFIFFSLLRQNEFKKNFIKVLSFLKIWQKTKDWLW